MGIEFFKWLQIAPVWIQGVIVIASLIAVLVIVVVVGYFIVKLAMRFYNFGFKAKAGLLEIDTSKDAPGANEPQLEVKSEIKS